MANRESSAGAGLCPPAADGSPTLQPVGQEGRGVWEKTRCKEGKAAGSGGSSQTYLGSHRCGIYTGRDRTQCLPQFPHPPLGCPWCKALPRLSRRLSCVAAEPPCKASPVWGATPPSSRLARGGTGAPAQLSPAVAASPPMNGGRALFSLGSAASSSLLNHV